MQDFRGAEKSVKIELDTNSGPKFYAMADISMTESAFTQQKQAG
ncbi:MAG: hypothetical protein GQF41_0069 [Candidatus Rifleibacterium amylolyticum]|nr:MAG: hypothetical protein GQF41_0069 [Candidatus Rifleibacterium amylolyticum]